MANKVTKRVLFETLKTLCEDGTFTCNIETDSDEVITEQTFIDFCEKEIASLDAKAVKAKERALAKRAAGDELQAVIASLLTNEPQTAEQLLAQIEDESGELTKQKIVAKMRNLVDTNQASKCDIKVEVDGKNVSRKAYTLPVDAE